MKKTRLISILILSGAVLFAGKASVNFQKPALARTGSVGSIDLVINADKAIHGLQFDLAYNPAEIKLEKASASDKFMFETREVSDGVIRGIIFSMEGLAINEGLKFDFSPLPGFEGSSNIDFNEIILADSHGNEVEAAEAQSYEISFSNSLLPAKTELTGAYPNPFNPSSTVNYGLSTESHVEIMIYDAAGRLVEELVNQHQAAGYHFVTWNASSQASGMYFAKMVAGDIVQTQKLMLLK